MTTETSAAVAHYAALNVPRPWTWTDPSGWTHEGETVLGWEVTRQLWDYGHPAHPAPAEPTWRTP